MRLVAVAKDDVVWIAGVTIELVRKCLIYEL